MSDTPLRQPGEPRPGGRPDENPAIGILLGRLSSGPDIDDAIRNRTTVFGSVAIAAGPASDLDILVDLRGTSYAAEYARTKPGLLRKLAPLLQLARWQYGAFDPFLRFDDVLLVRSGDARAWHPAGGDRTHHEPRSTTMKPQSSVPGPVAEADAFESNSNQRFYEVQVGFIPEDSTTPTHLGTWQGLAATRREAKSMAADEHWDARLDCASARQSLSVADISNKRYIVCSGWGHIFVGKREELTRWVFDRGTDKLVTAQIQDGMSGRWIDLHDDAARDLQESLGDNEMLGGADSPDLMEDVEYAARPPQWSVGAENESGSTSPQPDEPRRAVPRG